MNGPLLVFLIVIVLLLLSVGVTGRRRFMHGPDWWRCKGCRTVNASSYVRCVVCHRRRRKR